MGVYDIVGVNEIQIKLLPDASMRYFAVGDEIPLRDGVYFGYGGWFAVYRGEVAAEGNEQQVYNKWGGPIPIDLDSGSPVVQAIAEIDND